MQVFCGQCKDYIYDCDFERVKADEERRMNMVVAKLKCIQNVHIDNYDLDPDLPRVMPVQEWTPAPEDLVLIKKRGKQTTCSGNIITFLFFKLIKKDCVAYVIWDQRIPILVIYNTNRLVAFLQ